MPVYNNDYDKLKTLLIEFGVEFSEDTSVTFGTVIYSIQCNQGDRKVDGYTGFFTRFRFGAEGKFIDMGAWE